MVDVKKLSGEDKLRLVMGRNSWSNYSLGGKLYSFNVSDASNGLRTKEDLEDDELLDDELFGEGFEEDDYGDEE